MTMEFLWNSLEFLIRPLAGNAAVLISLEVQLEKDSLKIIWSQQQMSVEFFKNFD